MHTGFSRRAELHHSSRRHDQWGRDSVAKLLSILITDTAVHRLLSPHRPPEAETERGGCHRQTPERICDSVERRL